MLFLSRRDFMRASAIPLLGAALGTDTTALGAPIPENQRPNIILMLVDDMGFSDIGCYGGEIGTPNLDALAARGVRFTQFHNAARCCPTRASLMTGLYPHQVGLKRNGQSLTRDGVTVAEALKEAGYDTAMVGKWHLSKTLRHPGKKKHQQWVDHQIEYGPFGPPETYPSARGFDHFYGVIWGVINHFDPFSLVEDGEPVKNVPADYYFTDAITDKAVEYIRDFSRSGNPFFLYYAHCAPHWPLHARQEDVAKYAGTYDNGWEQLRKDRYARQLEMGLFDEETASLPPLMDGGDDWSALSAEQRRYQARKMAVHAAMVDRIDQNLGRVLDTLKETGQYDNTLIVFLSDNGASPERVQWGPGYDRTAETRAGEKVLYGYDSPPLEAIGSEKTYLAIGPAWANAANTPFKYWKKESYEGGMNTPCILHWPAGLKAKSGSITPQPAHVMDIMPTCLELAGQPYPAEYNGRALLPLEGRSLGSVIAGGPVTGDEEYYFEHERGRAVRKDGWKLVAPTQAPDQWELYHVAEDLTETHNLVERYPDKARALKKAWQRWAARVGLKQR